MPEISRLRCSEAEAVATLKALWTTDYGRIHLSPDVCTYPGRVTQRDTRPLMATMPEMPRTVNPLWDIVRWFPTSEAGCCGALPKVDGFHHDITVETLNKLSDLGINRATLCRTYAFSIISPSDVAWIASMTRGRDIVEINAGRGYWAWQLEQEGVNVAAYDPHVPGDDNEYFTTPGTFTQVMRRDHTAVELHPDRVLMTVWPDYEGAYAAQALKLYHGDMLIFAGEGYGGCTASDEFFDILESDWDWLSSAPMHVTWYGIHCRLEAYVRKTKALTK